MTVRSRDKGFSALFAVGMAVLLVFVFASAVVEAAPVPDGSTPVGYWSYGAVKTVSVGPQRAADGWTYQGNATFGYTVTIYDNNTSTSDFQLTIERTTGASFTLNFCYPSCTLPTSWATLTYRAWEVARAVSNLTTNGTVTENGNSDVPAVALLSSTVTVAANVTETAFEHLANASPPGNRTGYLSGSVQGRSVVGFAEPLGLIPLSLTPGSSWSSTSPFHLAGSANYSFYLSLHGPVKKYSLGPVTGPISVVANGTVTVDGAYAPGSTVKLGGITYPAISLTVLGPFSVREGVIFVPAGADLFSGANPSWEQNESAATSVDQSTVDVQNSVDGHFGLGASSLRYSASSLNPADSASGNTAVTEATPAAASNAVSSAVVQGEPESSSQVSATQQCLQSGAGCSSLGATGSSSNSFLGVIILAGAVACVGALIAVGVVSRRRSIPPPAYPNAALYPPGASRPARTERAPASPGGPPSGEEDPLDHLW